MLSWTSTTSPPGPRTPPRAQLGLPPTILACLFDLDGVLTQTARLHAAAWKTTFDEYLCACAARRSQPFVPFDAYADLRFVDGRPRADGVRSFLAARGVVLPEGQPTDPVRAETVHGLGNRKNEIVQALIASEGVETYEGSVRYVLAAMAAGFPCAVVSSSANCREVMQAGGIDGLFEVVVDGVVATARELRGKPAPDTFLEAAAALGVRPGEAAVFEDAEAGVEAGRAGGFGFVVGIDRDGGRSQELVRHGADLVVTDLSQLLRID